ncbi:hypothetical protein ALUC_60154S [Aspergillus luchuensis]|nr:hypothetical protein ALUC_60154S [Aspergillus luchuensis]
MTARYGKWRRWRRKRQICRERGPSGLYPFHPPGLVLWLQQYPLHCSIIWQSLRGCTPCLPSSLSLSSSGSPPIPLLTHFPNTITSLSAMPNPSQLLLLADHIKLSLLERQRAISLDLEPNSQDGEISRSLDSLKEGIDAVESDCARLEEANDESATEMRDQLDHLYSQYRDLTSQFRGSDGAAADDPVEFTNIKKSSPDLKQPVPQHPSSKSVRFMDNAAEEDDLNRRNLFQPYRDSPSPQGVDTSNMSNQQVYDHHEQIMRDQDEQLDRLGESIGRQHQLSIQIGDELEGHVALLDDMDGHVERHQGRLDKAKRRLDKFRRSASENWSMMTIIGLIIVLVILIVLLK